MTVRVAVCAASILTFEPAEALRGHAASLPLYGVHQLSWPERLRSDSCRMLVPSDIAVNHGIRQRAPVNTMKTQSLSPETEVAVIQTVQTPQC